MRAFEFALLVTGIPLLLRPFLPIRDRRRWTGLLLALPALFAALHLILEGPRWQMVPAYALIGLLLLLTALRALRPARSPAGRKVWAIVLSGLGGLLLAVAFALSALFPIFRLPRPSGPYHVGTVTYHWLDAGRDETFTDDPTDRRELMVQLWYPAEGVRGAKRALYLEHSEIIGPVLGKVQFGLPPFVFSHLRYVRGNAIPGAPVAAAQLRYPVLLFSHGRGGLRVQNTFQTEELASHGYVVAAIDHTYAAAATVFPDGRVVSVDPRVRDVRYLENKFELLANDARFVLDQLEALEAGDPEGRFRGRLDLDRVGIFGHSLGGVIAALACQLDERFRAGMDIDAFVPRDVVEGGLAQPFMFITRDAATMEQELARQDPEKRREAIDEQMGSIHAFLDRAQSPGYLVEIRGLYHFNATDLPLWTPLTSALGMTGPIDAARAHRIINAYTLAFYNRHLSGEAAPLLDGPSPDYPEVEFAVHGAGKGCTILYAADDRVALAGNNEDYNNPYTYVWFVPPEPGKYGRVYFGYEDGFPQGGVNEKGLFFDGAALSYKALSRSDDKPVYDGVIPRGNLFDKIMSESATVSEALAILDAYGRYGMDTYQILIGDAGGDSAIVDGDTILRKQGPFQLATNFRLSEHPGPPYPCRRYSTALDRLSNAGSYSVELFRDILNATHQEPPYPTLYSNVYDLKNGLIYLYYHHDFENVVVIDVAAELAQEFHFYPIASLFASNAEAEGFQTQRTSAYETRVPVRVTPTGQGPYADYAGDYRVGEMGEAVSVYLDAGRLYFWQRFSLPIELLSGAEGRFFHLFHDGNEMTIDFERDLQGAVMGATGMLFGEKFHLGRLAAAQARAQPTPTPMAALVPAGGGFARAIPWWGWVLAALGAIAIAAAARWTIKR